MVSLCSFVFGEVEVFSFLCVCLDVRLLLYSCRRCCFCVCVLYVCSHCMYVVDISVCVRLFVFVCASCMQFGVWLFFVCFLFVVCVCVCYVARVAVFIYVYVY